jgi:hypothetical protein
LEKATPRPTPDAGQDLDALEKGDHRCPKTSLGGRAQCLDQEFPMKKTTLAKTMGIAVLGLALGATAAHASTNGAATPEAGKAGCGGKGGCGGAGGCGGKAEKGGDKDAKGKKAKDDKKADEKKHEDKKGDEKKPDEKKPDEKKDK